MDDLNVVAHEYGHYVNSQMWGDCSAMTDASAQTKEGFAIFYSFAARNYGTSVYGDDLQDWADNTETAPFETPRYHNIWYTTVHPEYSRFACFLWGLYDSYNDAGFLASEYMNADNDDVNGHGLRVFNVIRNNVGVTPANVLNHFKADLDIEEWPSIHDVYDCMFIGPDRLMRSAQVKNGSWSVSGNSMTLSWDTQSYGPTDRFYGNYEDGYSVFRYVNDEWVSIASPSRGTNNITFSPPVYGLYKVTARNAAGLSYNPVYISQIQKQSGDGDSFGFGACTFLSIYPNPAGARISFEYYLSESRYVEMVVVNAAGQKTSRVLGAEKSQGFHNSILDVSGLPVGTYYAQLSATDATGQVQRKRLPFSIVR